MMVAQIYVLGPTGGVGCIATPSGVPCNPFLEIWTQPGRELGLVSLQWALQSIGRWTCGGVADPADESEPSEPGPVRSVREGMGIRKSPVPGAAGKKPSRDPGFRCRARRLAGTYGGNGGAPCPTNSSPMPSGTFAGPWP